MTARRIGIRLAAEAFKSTCAIPAILFVAVCVQTVHAAAASAEPTLTLVDRSIRLDRVTPPPPNGAQGQYTAWDVEYALRAEGLEKPLEIPSPAIFARIEGWASNSRARDHGAPRKIVHELSLLGALADNVEVISSEDEGKRCRERALVQIWTDRQTPPTDSRAKTPPLFRRIEPGAIVHVRLRLEHRHFLEGSYDPLLGVRSLELRLGPLTFRDDAPLDRDRPHRSIGVDFAPIKADFLDARQYVSPPDSLHLEAHRSGRANYHFDARPVRRDKKMRLRFWYLVAPGTRGECLARLTQNKDHPTVWRILSDGGLDESLSTVGRWVLVERVFRVDAEATSIALDFRLTGSEVGELWIDDVSLEPLKTAPSGP